MTTPTTETTPFPTLRPEPFCSGPCATASPERMRRALLAVGATEPARVTVGEIVECLRGGCDEERMAMADTLEATITGGGK